MHSEQRLKTIWKAGQTTLDTTFKAGQECGRDGATVENCHFRHFATPELTAEWERGKAIGEEERKANGAGQHWIRKA